ncbi:nucleotidyltransferase domain-containing protein [Bacillus salitolerans]|uniref:Nucleotidyltransferase domain-containing protein n=1 Tax=Bacillus salitolerans TaxID=1437434 RepID=A0ABW4LSL2_9BACI
MNELIEKIKTYLEEKYNCHTLILYGSYNSGDFTAESDIDIIGFSQEVEELNDVNSIEGKQLDAWIYNTNKIKQPEQFLRINEGTVLVDTMGLGVQLLTEIQTIYNNGPKKLTQEEKDFLKGWLKKMYVRSIKSDIEGNYRLNWMLKDSLEIYFELKGIWFLGPKKAFKWLKENDSMALHLFEKSLDREADNQDIKKLIEYITLLS